MTIMPTIATAAIYFRLDFFFLGWFVSERFFRHLPDFVLSRSFDHLPSFTVGTGIDSHLMFFFDHFMYLLSEKLFHHVYPKIAFVFRATAKSTYFFL
jgi:hypothetical protein